MRLFRSSKWNSE